MTEEQNNLTQKKDADLSQHERKIDELTDFLLLKHKSDFQFAKKYNDDETENFRTQIRTHVEIATKVCNVIKVEYGQDIDQDTLIKSIRILPEGEKLKLHREKYGNTQSMDMRDSAFHFYSKRGEHLIVSSASPKSDLATSNLAYPEFQQLTYGILRHVGFQGLSDSNTIAHEPLMSLKYNETTGGFSQTLHEHNSMPNENVILSKLATYILVADIESKLNQIPMYGITLKKNTASSLYESIIDPNARFGSWLIPIVNQKLSGGMSEFASIITKHFFSEDSIHPLLLEIAEKTGIAIDDLTKASKSASEMKARPGKDTGRELENITNNILDKK